MHTTNYQNTFICVADDCPILDAEVPNAKPENKTVAQRQFEIISGEPYTHTSDEIVFQIFAERKDLHASEMEEGRAAFFSKGQPCFRASPLPKRYGWGVHYNEKGQMAIYAQDSEMYKKLSSDAGIKVLKAMKSSR
jgi:Family of unknown function (DUF6157)